MITKPLWQPEIGVDGRPTGVYLDHTFARACDQVRLTDMLRTQVESYVWRITKPANKSVANQPSNIFTFWGDPGLRYESGLGDERPSLLIAGVHVRHYASDGKWLTANDYRIPVDYVLSYAFHHASRPEDHVANRWLLFAFSRWVQFAAMHLQDKTRKSL